MESKLKHLEFVQNVINRMANTSFLLKGWSITIVAGLFAFSVKEGLAELLWLSILLTSVFWCLDSYFLCQERRFRALYNHVRKLSENEIDFAMDPKTFKSEVQCHWYSTPFSITLWPFYFGAVLTQFIFIFLLTC